MTAGEHLKDQLNVRISDEAHAALRALAERQGLTQAGVLEVLLRNAARESDLPLARLTEQYQAERELRQRSRHKRGKIGGRPTTKGRR